MMDHPSPIWHCSHCWAPVDSTLYCSPECEAWQRRIYGKKPAEKLKLSSAHIWHGSATDFSSGRLSPRQRPWVTQRQAVAVEFLPRYAEAFYWSRCPCLRPPARGA
jgi:hypothetical protein